MDSEPDEISRIRTILIENPKGLTTEEIAKKLPLNRTSTAKYLNTLLISGQAEMRTYGRAKVFTLSQRIPFSQMLNLSSDLLIVLDRDLAIKQVNDPLVKTFNLQQEALAGTKIENSQLLPYFENNLEMIRESSKGKEITKLERIEIQGNEFFFRMKMIPVVFDQGEQGLAVILQDITELKQHQLHLEGLVEERTQELQETNDKLLEEMKERQKSLAALENSERKYRELVENANSIILRVNDKGAILFFNEFAERFFGASESEMLGKNIFGTILSTAIRPDKSPDEFIREFLISSEHQAYNEVPCSDKNGEPVWVAWTIRPVMDSNNVPVEFLLVGIDITERKNVESALQRVNAKLNLVSSIARHDILNKLTIISATISLLKDMIHDATQQGYLQHAEDAMIAIKNQILFTRDFKDMGMEKPYWQVLDDIFLQIQEAIRISNAELEIPARDLEIFADPWLNKVFLNLINYIRYHGKSQTKITVSFQEVADGLEINIKDNGNGIPADKKEKIFERGSGETNGYDLFLVREILAITGLTIEEIGEPGNGVNFVIRVPKRAYRFGGAGITNN
jgi:PAS domain S-box-containing protein